MEAERDQGRASGPKEQLIILVRLQALDRERDGNDRLVEQTDGIVAARGAELERARAVLEKSAQELKAARIDAHGAEVDLKAQSDEINKLELQLNTAKTNQEYTALQNHIAKIRAAASKEEEETLVLYDRIEGLEARLAEGRDRVKTLEEEYEQFKQTCEADRRSALGELAQTDDRRAALLRELPENLSSTYERIRKVRDGMAVAACENRCCSGCGVRVKPNDLARMAAGTQIITCESCQRVLYLPQALKAQPEP